MVDLSLSEMENVVPDFGRRATADTANLNKSELPTSGVSSNWEGTLREAESGAPRLNRRGKSSS